MGFEEFQPSHWYFSDIRGHTLLVTILLFIILLILLISFMFYLFVRHQINRSTSTARTLSITEHTNAIPAPSLGLDPTVINSLPILTHQSVGCSFREKECAICLGMFEDKEMVKVMPGCLHAFHTECVDEWLRSRSTCPLCRSSLDSSSEPVMA